MEQFVRACSNAAKEIREGSLYGGDEYPDAQQVDQSSWEHLAQINELGMLTWVSQDAINWKTHEPNFTERSFVSGIMPAVFARSFVEDFSLRNNDKFASLCLNVPKSCFKEKSDGKFIRGTTNFDEVRGTHIIEMRGPIIGTIPNETMSLLKHIHKLPDKLDLIGVDVIDLHWGRMATSKNGLWKSVTRSLAQVKE